MKYLNYTLIISIISIIVSCNNTTNNKIVDKQGKELNINKIISHNNIITDTTVSFSYFLPKEYNGKDDFPVIFFFDPHGNGNLPLNNYSTLANKHKYIFIGINGIRNGQPVNYTYNIFTTVLSEVKNRFAIDKNRIFTAGFSGGAKLAMIFAQKVPDVIGVIACGASLTMSDNTKPDYYYVGIVGDKDFNYLEVQQTLVIYEKLNFDFTSIIFNGEHQWPLINSFDMALNGFDIYSIKTKKISKNKELINNIWETMNDSISTFNKREDMIQENIYINQTLRWFSGLKNTSLLQKRSYEIIHSKQFINYIKKHQKLITLEVKLRSEFIRAFNTKDIDWWEKEVQRINKSIKNTDKEISDVSTRLKNYLSMVSFILIKKDLNIRKTDADVLKKMKIYKMVDPNNPDVYLMYSYYYMLLNDIVNMTHNFTDAKEKGFNDFETYKNDEFWSSLFNKKEIIKLREY